MPLSAAEGLTVALTAALPGVLFFVEFHDSDNASDVKGAVSSVDLIEVAIGKWPRMVQQMKDNIKVFSPTHAAYDLPILRYQVHGH